jgi:hypothetical protein
LDTGLEILAFPCNQFGGQEPGSNEEIQNFVCTRFKAEYPIFDKVVTCVLLVVIRIPLGLGFFKNKSNMIRVGGKSKSRKQMK